MAGVPPYDLTVFDNIYSLSSPSAHPGNRLSALFGGFISELSAGRNDIRSEAKQSINPPD
jgi:hypothetical protein